MSLTYAAYTIVTIAREYVNKACFWRCKQVYILKCKHELKAEDITQCAPA